MWLIIESQRKRYYKYIDEKEKKKIPKHIYHIDNRYVIVKSINGCRKYFKALPTLEEAIDYKNRLIDNNWEPLPLSDEEILEKNTKEYYKGIHLSTDHRRFIVNNPGGGYMGACYSIEEALQFRDKYYGQPTSTIPRPAILDLKKDNPHITEGLKYPLPERLTPTKKSNYGKGSIRKKGEASYHIYYGGKGNGKKPYYCSCRTYEQAYYVRKRLQECDWDRSQLETIFDEYPKWYTWLMEFYKYIILDTDYYKRKGIRKYLINYPRGYLEEGVSLEHIGGYNNVEDALFERDWLMNNEWDYEALVYTIDDRENPYYDMELPPYPERKIRNLVDRDYHEKELTEIFHLIYDDGIVNQEEICERMGINSSVTLRNWLNKFWNSSWGEFKQISLTGENPINVLEKNEIIYQPDLSKTMPSNFNGWVQKNGNCKRSPYQVRKGNVEYGYYPTEKMARQVVKKLVACNWDKTKLQAIKDSVGYKPLPTRHNVYPTGKGYAIRKKNKQRKMINYGYYQDKRLAELTRDFLENNKWDKEQYPELRKEAEYNINLIDTYPTTMFDGGNSHLREYNLEYYEENKDFKYYYPSTYGYHITRYINGKAKSFGYYDSEEEAQKIVEILKLNNWDKSSLTDLKGGIF